MKKKKKKKKRKKKKEEKKTNTKKKKRKKKKKVERPTPAADQLSNQLSGRFLCQYFRELSESGAPFSKEWLRMLCTVITACYALGDHRLAR